MLQFNFTKRVPPKVLINLGSLLDIPTSSLVTGKKGETIINGGLGTITAVIGGGNNFKSTILHYMTLAAADRIAAATPTAIASYDTEMNVSLDRLESLASKFEHLPENIIQSENAMWSVTDKSLMDGSEWINEINKYVTEKEKDKKNHIDVPCFKDPYSDAKNPKPLNICIPTFVEIDSFTEFEGAMTMEMLTKDIEGSDTNTYAMKQGLFKTKFFSTLPNLSASSYTYFLLTGHLQEKLNMASGPSFLNKPTKKVQYLKADETVKGASSKFLFLTTILWKALTASVLKNQGTGKAEYPLTPDDKLDSDLNTVTLQLVRNKNGASGQTITLVVSQTEGVLPTLSEFHFIKENNRFGLDGSNISYNLFLYPECKLSRTTVRGKINSDPKLRRAINITSELLQLSIHHPVLTEQGLICTPQELYEDIKALGYDWEEILSNTRGYWTLDQYTNKVPFLSTVDLLKIRKGLYTPYFKLNKK